MVLFTSANFKQSPEIKLFSEEPRQPAKFFVKIENNELVFTL